MKHKIYYLPLIILSILLISCSEDVNEPTTKDGTPPRALASDEITVIPTPGGAVVKFIPPNESDVLAIEAHYTISSGKKFKVRASALADSLIIGGYLETHEYPVELYVVDRAENYSSATIVNINPDVAPITTSFESVNMVPEFGGVKVSWENKTRTPLAIFLFQEEDNGDKTLVDAYYSDAKNGSFTVRNMEAVEKKFHVQMRDRWQNYSDLYTDLITPFYEAELDYSQFQVMDSRYSKNASNTKDLSWLWTRKLHTTERDHLTSMTTYIPWNASFTVGKETKLSRIVIWQYGWSFNNYGQFYGGGNARTYNFYGSNNPNPDGSLDSTWKLFLTADIKKPSGNPFNTGTMTEEDFDVAYNRGHEFMVPIETPSYKYIRMECTRSFEGGSMYGHSYRIQMFGDNRN